MGFDILVSDQIYIKIPLRKLSPKVKFFYGKGEFKMTKSDHARIPLFFFKDDKWLKNIFYNTILYSYNYTLSFNNIKLFHTKNINTPYDMAKYRACIYFPSVVSILQLFNLYNLIPKWLNILRLRCILSKPNTNTTTDTLSDNDNTNTTTDTLSDNENKNKTTKICWGIDIIELKFNNNQIPFFHTLHSKLLMLFPKKNESIINNMMVEINAKRNNVLHLKLTTSVLVNDVSMRVVFAKKLLWIIKGISIQYQKWEGVTMCIHIKYLFINFVALIYPLPTQIDNDKKFLQQNNLINDPNYSNNPFLTNDSQVQSQSNYIGPQIDNINSTYNYTSSNNQQKINIIDINNHYTNGDTINNYPIK